MLAVDSREKGLCLLDDFFYFRLFSFFGLCFISFCFLLCLFLPLVFLNFSSCFCFTIFRWCFYDFHNFWGQT